MYIRAIFKGCSIQMTHHCTNECESIHKNIIAKVILTILEGRQIDLLPTTGQQSRSQTASGPVAIRPAMMETPKLESPVKSSINKWVTKL
jgi:hypothetical protein